ncbi:MAG: hypothetical protein OCD01_11125 [Fibrobacterales bacterium]
MKRHLPVIAVGVASLFMFIGCFHHKSPEEKAAWIVEEITDELELTEEQQTLLEDVKVQVLEKRSLHEREKEKHHTALKEMFLNENMTSDSFIPFIDTHAQKIKEEGQPIWDAFVLFQNSLSKEQREVVVEHLEAFKKKGRGCHF